MSRWLQDEQQDLARPEPVGEDVVWPCDDSWPWEGEADFVDPEGESTGEQPPEAIESEAEDEVDLSPIGPADHEEARPSEAGPMRTRTKAGRDIASGHAGMRAEGRWLGLGLAGSLVLHVGLMTLVVATARWDAVSSSPRRTVSQSAQVEVLPQQDPLGLRGGLGEAVAQFDSEQALRAAQALQDQPWLGMTAPGPTLHMTPASDELAKLQRPVELPAMPTLTELSAAMEAGREGETAAVESDEGPVAGDAGESAPSTDSPTAQPRPTETAAIGGGDPGAAAGREVDLFAREAVADFRAGQTVAREGRDHRIRGLRRGLSAYFDQALLPRPIIIRYRIEVDSEGTPIRIDIVRSSGSDALDLEVRRQLFLSWFDPDPSGDGSDLGRPFLFTLRIV